MGATARGAAVTPAGADAMKASCLLQDAFTFCPARMVKAMLPGLVVRESGDSGGCLLVKAAQLP
jgi:hypothetical protein